jgi:hypothetical protein
MHPVPRPGRKGPDSTFLAYVQRFDVVSQPPPTLLAVPGQEPPFPDPATGMFVVKRSTRSDGTRVGGIVPVDRFRVVADLVPRFGVEADARLTKETSAEYTSIFFLNKYFEKNFYYSSSRL